MGTAFICEKPGRKLAVLSDGNLNGIDYLEVTTVDQKTLKVFFLFNLPGQSSPVPAAGAPLTDGNIRIEGGVRVRNINAKISNVSGKVLTITVDAAGDFSTYTLRLVTSPTNDTPPAGFDPTLSAIEFSFKVGCPSDFDCETETTCPTEVLPEPELDYLAKDFASFRRLMFDRMSAIMPEWGERNPADMEVALVELLAHVGDHLSYYQDAVATEAFPGTARKRVSIRRHARLRDYFLHDGCNARTWVTFEVDSATPANNKTLPARTLLLTRGSSEKVQVLPANVTAALREDPIAFATLEDLTIVNTHNKISFYTWSDSECCLPLGSTRATLLNNPALTLTAGDALLFEEILGPTTGLAVDADPAHRHVVRLKKVTAATDPLNSTPVLEVEWFEEDALPFALCLTALVVMSGGSPQIIEASVARANTVLAEHGLSVSGETLLQSNGLRRTDVTCREAYVPAKVRLRAATLAILQDPRKALPVVSLNDGTEDWTPVRDLLSSDRFAPEFVVETERDGTASLRFGDDILGKNPSESTQFSVTYQIGNGAKGNIGRDALSRIVFGFSGIRRVRNPVAARGGSDPESIELARLFAPQAFRTQERAVTAADYAEITERHPEVQKAVARFRWTGSWYTVFITLDRKGGRPVDQDPQFKSEIAQHIEQYRMAGYDVEIRGPVFVPLDILITVCVKAGYFRSDVKQSLRQVFSRAGFFHPDNFTFGQPVYLSQIYRAVMNVAGVASAEIIRLQRWGKTASQELQKGVLAPGPLEVVRLDNDPNFPENGKIDFDVKGGL